MLKKITSFSKLLDYLRNNPRRFAFAFHRVSKEKHTRDNPFNFLSNIPPSQFKILIKLLKLKTNFIDLDNLLSKEETDTFRSFVHFTFDDVSTSFIKNVLPIVEKYQIPVTIFLSAKNAETGFSWRDKIYFILDNSELLRLFVEKTQLFFGKKAEIDEKNMYRWSKSPDFNQKLLEECVIDEIMDKYVDDFNDKVKKYRPYLNWEELSELSNHPLITIGNHGFNHYNFNSLTDQEIKNDIIKSHKLIEKRLGIKCRHFAVPFGDIDQRSFLISDRILTEMGYKTVGWGKRVNNPRMLDQILKHYFRIDSGPNMFINIGKICKAYVKTQYSPLSGIPFSSYRDPEAKIDFVNHVDREEYKTFYRRLLPHKFHHQNDKYIDYLYYKNPFRGKDPLHFAIKVNNDIFVIGSFLYIPYLHKGKKHDGAYLGGWYRFPQLPRKSFSAKKIVDETRKYFRVGGTHNLSPDAFPFARHMDKVKVYRLKARIKRKRRTVNTQLSWVLSSKWDSKLQRIIDASHKNLLVTIQRGEEVYKWRFERYPLNSFSYFYPSISEPKWFIVFCTLKNTMYITDFCLISLHDKRLISEMFLYVKNYCFRKNIKEAILVTSNELILEIARKNRFKIEESFINFYLPQEGKGKEVSWEEVHETQISGDLLPR